MAQTHYKSDIKLGEKYEHVDNGVVGIAIAIYFFRHACERVTLSRLVEHKVVEDTFDAMELKAVKTGRPARTKKPGGPAREVNPRQAVRN